MRTIIQSTLLLFCLNTLVFAQSGWFWLNPLPQGNAINSFFYVSPGTIFGAGNNGAIIKSNDSGKTWSYLYNNIIHDLGSTWFVNNLTGFAGAPNGIIYKSVNGGINWNPVYTGNTLGTGKIIFTSPSTGFALQAQSAYPYGQTIIIKTTDSGENWFTSLVPDNVLLYDMHFASPLVGFATGRTTFYNYSRIYKTSNAGISWDSIRIPYSGTINSIQFINENTGYFLGQPPAGNLYKCTNGGYNWSLIYSGIGSNVAKLQFLNESTGFISTENLYKTTNGGFNWIVVTAMIGGSSPVVFSDENNGVRAYAGYIYRTLNSGVNWAKITTGISGSISGIDFVSPTTAFICNYEGIIYKSTNAGISWDTSFNVRRLTIDYTLNCIKFYNEQFGIAGIDSGKVARTTSAGINWAVFLTGTYDHIHAISIPSQDTVFAGTKAGQVLRSVNGGANWTNLGRVLTFCESIYFINVRTGFVGGQNLSDSTYISKTTDCGLTFRSIRTIDMEFISDIFFINSNTGFAAGFSNQYEFRGVIARTTDCGETWQTTLTQPGLYSVHFPSQQTGYAVGEENEIYKTTNSGGNWVKTYCLMSGTNVYFTDENTGYVTGGSSIIKTTTGGGDPISIRPISSEIPKHFILRQNYSNPFNPVTKIRFNIPVVGQRHAFDVQIIIYDILGREIAVLVNEQLKPGLYEVSWDGTNYPSGVYFYRLTTNQFTQTRKMVLLK